MTYTYAYPHPAVTVDIVAFTLADDALKALLVRRDSEPFRGRWALPGGFVGMDESLRRAAYRELHEETGVRAGFLEQLHAFGRPDRDPRERVISIAYLALLSPQRCHPEAGSDAREAALFDVQEPPVLAFDHDRILGKARARLREKLDDPAVPLQLLDDTFTMRDLRRVYELIGGESVDTRNFLKKMIALDHIEETGDKRRSAQHRPARLYRVKNPRDVPYR